MPAASPEVSSFASRTASSSESRTSTVTVLIRAASLAYAWPSRTSSGATPAPVRALALGGAHEPDRTRREAGPLERWAEDLVDEDGDGAERRAAGAQDAGVQALQELPGDVEGDVRARLEVRPDRADGNAALLHEEAVLEAALADLALEGLELCHAADLGGERFDALLVESQAVERSLVEPACRPLDV